MCRLFGQVTKVFLKAIPVVAFSATVISTAFAFEPTEVAKLVASDGASNEQFGLSVAIDGDTIVIGASLDDDLGTYSGSAYVFTKVGVNWVKQAKLTASDGVAYDRFGESVAIDGDTIVVGAYGKDEISGSAYVFIKDGMNWVEQAKLVASDGAPDDNFGWSVAIYMDTAVISAYRDCNDAGFYSGAAYVFVRADSTWSEQSKLIASDGASNEQFGRSVAIDGDKIVIGAFSSDFGWESGSAYVFISEGMNWVEQAKLIASDATAEGRFGDSVAIYGDTIVVGANGDDEMGWHSGSAYVFIKDSMNWVEQAKLIASDGVPEDMFGHSVAIDGDTIVVGAFGDDDSYLGSGSAYIFLRNGTSWTEWAKLTASDSNAYDTFGYAVAMNGSTIVIGAKGDDDLGDRSGSAYVFSLSPSLRCVGFEPPMADYPVRFKRNHSLPLRAEVFETDGLALTDLDLAAPPVVQVWFDSGTDDDAIDVSDEVLPVGQGDEGNQFIFTEAGKWEFILGTKNYKALGIYTVSMRTGDQSEYVFDPTCVTEFVVE